MTNYYKYCNIMNKNYDVYIFIMCNDYKNQIHQISKLLGIEKIPKKMFENFKIKTSFEKKLYTDKFEIIFYGIDKNNKCSNESLYDSFGQIGKSLLSEEYINKKILVQLVSDDKLILKNEIISFILGYYRYNELKTSIQKNNTVISFFHKNKKFNSIIESSIYEGNIQNEIRSLINQPANILNSSKYLNYIKTHIEKNIKIKILNEKMLKKEGCNLILGVNKGSENKAMMIILEYKHNYDKNKHKTIALIGKGVMFDSGGYNIKRGDFSDMKNDMTGSAIVFGLMNLLSFNKIDGHFVGFLPIVENMVDSSSIRPGDIIKSYSGKTVEVIDTDAEGRLILADALSYSKNYNPYLCIDIATLTGQVSSIFDNKSSVIMGNNNKYIQKMILSGKENNEKFWELPMWKEYISMTKSNIADLRNYSRESKASTIMGGAFLSNFIPANSNWLHLDIAGNDNLIGSTSKRFSGATGENLRTIFYFLEHFYKQNYEK